ncbi:MAG TPA: membrane dipeptidase [Planctomycetota bacterium]|nr:membrane dipeptidase [Planctomycetota bacterium]
MSAAARPIIDSHLDLAYSAVLFNRDLTLPLAEIRRQETGMSDELCRGRNTVCFPELRRGSIRMCLATLLARGGPEQLPRKELRRSDLDSRTPALAYAQAHAQLAYYRLMESEGYMRQIRTRAELQRFWRPSHANASAPLGYILSMECADPITSPAQVEYWWNQGLRAVGPAHYGRSQYAYGTRTDGPLSAACFDILREFERLGMILDVTHLCDTGFYQALDAFRGPVLASHHNCRALVAGDRQLNDAQIRLLIERGAVIGVALDAWMLHPGWERGKTSPELVPLASVAEHIDHICQLAGNVNHVAIGSDLDGGFGTEQTPRELQSIADLQKLDAILEARGYDSNAIDAIFHGNWLRFLEQHLPA